ncbi:MAG: DNA mismatch repair protein MutS [Abditibacteriota bacterium]|nr:DNA mismatch repair protein MutS [Abditibacteriota bacterium]
MRSPAKKKPTLEEQYERIKAEHPGTILMFRLGDFFEMFNEDAEIAAKELELTLTSRSQGYKAEAPMCGFPHHAIDKHLAKLVSKGYKVAVCDQLETPKKGQIVKRGVTRVVSAGTVTSDDMLTSDANNYLSAIASEGDARAVASVDVSTGEFAVTETESTRKLMDEIGRLSPAEVLLEEINIDLRDDIKRAADSAVTVEDFGSGLSPREVLLNHFKTGSLRGFGAEDLTAGLKAAAMALRYVEKMNPAVMESITSLSVYTTEDFMILDGAARRNLELTESLADGKKSAGLYSVMDRTLTAPGARLLRRQIDRPMIDPEKINRRLDAVTELYESTMLREGIRDALNGVRDMERLTGSVVAGTASARDMLALGRSLERVPALMAHMDRAEAKRLVTLRKAMENLEDVTSLINDAINPDAPLNMKDGGMIRDGYNEQLDEYRDLARNGKLRILESEEAERERTGIKNLKIKYNSVFGYYIEVSRGNLSLVPENYIRKQTLVNAERFITPEIKELEEKILGANDKALALEAELFREVREKVADQGLRISKVAKALAETDLLSALAEVAREKSWVRPTVNDDDALVIKNGRHPIVEHFLTERFVPNDTTVNTRDQRMLIITGPNMAGKSTYLRQVAVIVLLAQIGSYVPADSAVIGVCDRIFTRVGAHDELAGGQSTFMVEMNETANILNNATDRSLIVLDEIGRGTSTYDGLSIAWAVAEQLCDMGCRTLFATHYHHLNELESTAEGVKNYRIAVREEKDGIIWLRKIVPGGTDKSYGIEVARLAGLPPETIDRAREILEGLEKGSPEADKSLGRGVKIAERTETLQLSLFGAAKDPILEELEEYDISTASPIEVMNKLYDWQRRIKERN